MDDLTELQNTGYIIARVVIIDNCDDASRLSEVLSTTKYSQLNIAAYSKAEIDSELESSSFGENLSKSAFKTSIAGGRSVLHHYLYRDALTIPGSVVWVLDDDMRLSYLSNDMKIGKISAPQIVSEVIRLKKVGAAIGALRITGTPPIPGISTLRTQLLDIYYNLNKPPNSLPLESDLAYYSWSILSKEREYFYDYSQSHYSHLEFPSWANFHGTNSLPNILQGKANTRPRVWPAEVDNKLGFIPLGGSYLVLNPECLHEFPVVSPSISGIRGRRGDTFWGILNRYIRGRAINQCDLAIRQDRGSDSPHKFSLDHLFSDFVGSSFVRSMNTYYCTQEEFQGTLPARVRLSIGQDAVDAIVEQFRVHLEERRIQFLLNSYRIQGILNALKQLNAFKQNRFQTRELVGRFEPQFSTDQINEFNDRLRNFDKTDLEEFLASLKRSVKSYRQSSKTMEYDDDFISYSKGIVANLVPLKDLTYLGEGREGIVWSDGKYAYKHLRFGWSQFEQSHSEFLRHIILQQDISNHLVRLEQIIEDNGEIIFKTERYDGDVYVGGFLEDIIQLLRDCKTNQVVISNFHPHNLIVGSQGLKFCDIGSSIVPINDAEFLQMAKRAFLTYRFHFRNDLSEIMARSLYDDSIPELSGFNLFLKVFDISTKANVLDERLIELIKSKQPSRLLDYGCGKGLISEKLVKAGIEVMAYDIDKSIIERNKQRDTPVKYV
ncbi:MAG: class I SAM-dependent methyltransferase, partial [Candidatus Thorarchaeota archaeon]